MRAFKELEPRLRIEMYCNLSTRKRFDLAKSCECPGSLKMNGFRCDLQSHPFAILDDIHSLYRLSLFYLICFDSFPFAPIFFVDSQRCYPS